MPLTYYPTKRGALLWFLRRKQAGLSSLKLPNLLPPIGHQRPVPDRSAGRFPKSTLQRDKYGLPGENGKVLWVGRIWRPPVFPAPILKTIVQELRWESLILGVPCRGQVEDWQGLASFKGDRLQPSKWKPRLPVALPWSRFVGAGLLARWRRRRCSRESEPCLSVAPASSERNPLTLGFGGGAGAAFRQEMPLYPCERKPRLPVAPITSA